MGARIGIFGGTFDPPHIGHLILASEAYSQLGLTRLLWVLTAMPPHKLDVVMSPLVHRRAMLGLALRDEPAFELSTVDINRPGPHYTLDSIKLLRAQYAGSQMILLIGGDSLGDLPSWHKPGEVIAACDEIGVMRRPGDEVQLSMLESQLPGLSARVRFIDAPLLEISSHEIRERVHAGLPFRYYLPLAVYEYIVSQGLYRTP